MRETCVRAAERAREHPAGRVGGAGRRRRRGRRATWPTSSAAGGWEAPLRIDAEHLVLAALGAVPLIEVEAEGLPLSLVRAAEAVTARRPPRRPGARTPTTTSPASLFLAEAAVTATGAPLPVAPDAAERLAEELLAHGLEPDEVVAVLPHLPVQPETADIVVAIIRAAGIG